MPKLNLGCGAFKKEGYINLDISLDFKPDVVHDLNKFPYPFSDNTFDFIEADHVIEHLNEPFKAIEELHRISIRGGFIVIRVPHFSRGFTHPEHRRGFDVSLPYYFSPACGKYIEDIFTKIPVMELKSMKLNWLAQPYLKKEVLPSLFYYLALGFSKIVNFFANLSPMFCSRFWCFYVGGFEEIEFIFEVKK